MVAASKLRISINASRSASRHSHLSLPPALRQYSISRIPLSSTPFKCAPALFWGIYGPSLHEGQVMLGNPLRALLCVGAAYFLVGVLVPVFMLSQQGALNGFNGAGTTWATFAGALGAIGAVCIILAFRSGGVPTYVMPLVFAGAPLVNVIVSMATHPPKTAPNPMLARRRRRGDCAVLQTARLSDARASYHRPRGSTHVL